jgi:hypothetical protein
MYVNVYGIARCQNAATWLVETKQNLKFIGVGMGGRGLRTTPFAKKSLKLTVKFRSPEFFLKIDRGNFWQNDPPSANPGYAYEMACFGSMGDYIMYDCPIQRGQVDVKF